ncbi:craniofacial development protein 2-like [Elysia marginata]|uniref:Craniofacial development protein 2-like n=1 Tax=Elysia marginata TaxID=1093978 RepID=A0AAV4G2M4_9GAST|nr:craniofacial development protein 2-like [Elysia marginata]
MFETGETAQVIKEFQRYRINILGLSDVRWNGKNTYRAQMGEIMYYFCREDGLQRRGVAIVLGKVTNKSLREWDPANDRIVRVRLYSKYTKTTILQCYALTEDSLEEGFDFFCRESTSNGPANATTGNGCVMVCTEVLQEQPDDTRKIKSLAIYKRRSSGSSDFNQWEQLAILTSQAPIDSRVSDAKHIDGKLSGSNARINAKLLKSNDCASLKLACIARLVDNEGRTSTIKAVVEGKNFQDESSRLEPGENGHTQADYQPEITDEIENFMTILGERLKCMESRLEDSNKRDDRLEDKLEILNEKINNLDKTVTLEIDASGDRLEGQLDRMKERLEDKIYEINTRRPQYRIESEGLNEICTNISSQLSLVEKSVGSLDKNINSIGNQVREVKDSLPTSTLLSNKLDQMFAEVAATNNNLTESLDVLSSSCSNRLPEQVQEFFDVFGTGRKEWRLAFRGTAYNNVDIYPAYLFGTGIPADVEAGCKQFNRSVPCANHYRNTDAFDNWANVDKVLLALYVKGRMVKQITFNGQDSTAITWFEEWRVIHSSWSDLKTLTHNIFSIEGRSESDLLRRFYVSHQHGGCPKDKGWFVAAGAVPGRCPWEKKLAHPAFIYSKRNTVALWQSKNSAARADAMGIFIKYQ